jgi:RNA polymerase sigma-70 factor (ECF subfamily)
MTSSDIERLYREHQPALLRWLARFVRCEHTAADLAQESYLRIAGAPDDHAITHPRAFLFRTARNLALDHLRKMRVRSITAQPLDDAVDVAGPEASAETTVLDRQRVRLFQQALDTMPPRSREVFLLHRLHHRTYADIARRLGISESAVEKNIMRALSHCRRVLREQESEPA